MKGTQLLGDLQKKSGRYLGENTMKGIFVACALLSIITTAGIVLVLVFDAADFFRIKDEGGFEAERSESYVSIRNRPKTQSLEKDASHSL